MRVNIYLNGGGVFVASAPQGVVEGCLGFALLRRRNGIEEVVSTWAGLEEHQWTDYLAEPGDCLAYRVLPLAGHDEATPGPAALAQSNEFNRSVAVAQRPRRFKLGTKGVKHMRLRPVINRVGQAFREYLFGPLPEMEFRTR